MNNYHHRFSELFKQLGLPADAQGIRDFVARHSPLDPAIPLPNAPFWTPAQATLLREELLLDADWAEAIDQLNLALRGT